VGAGRPESEILRRAGNYRYRFEAFFSRGVDDGGTAMGDGWPTKGRDDKAAGHWVDAAPFRAQLRHLMTAGGLGSADVATLAGISPRLAGRLLHGHRGRPLRRISPDTAQRLIQLTGPSVRSLSYVVVPTGVARLQLRRLERLGWTVSTIAERIGVTTVELDGLVVGAETCTARLTVRLTALARAELAAAEAARPGCLSDAA
jgi:plasmid maintenance system antidote protein VapI